MDRQIEKIVEHLDDEGKAKLAAILMNEVNPNKENLEIFFDGLDDVIHGELISRAADQEER